MTDIRRVLVVDGDPSARRGLARLLRVAGHDVRECASVDEFLDALKPQMSGCVVLDLRMPGRSGEELQAELESRCADLTIIVVAADDDAETRRNARAMKAVAFFRKPVDGRALLDAVAWTQR
jgi:FixJ family two-component response regulator